MHAVEMARDFLPNSSQSTSTPDSVDTENPLVTRAKQSETLMKAAETLRRMESEGEEGKSSHGAAEATPASTHRATIAKQLEEAHEQGKRIRWRVQAPIVLPCTLFILIMDASKWSCFVPALLSCLSSHQSTAAQQVHRSL